MTTVAEMILFISSSSLRCKKVAYFVWEHRLPIEIVALNTNAQRATAQGSNKIKVKRVPTLLIKDDRGKVDLYEGVDKCMVCLESVQRAVAPTKGPQRKHKVKVPEAAVEIELIDEPDPTLQMDPNMSPIEKAALMQKNRERLYGL